MIINDNEEVKVCAEECVEEDREECQEWKNKYLLLSADFQNYKKRLTQERVEWGYEAQKLIILDLLTVIDDFTRAFEQEKKRETHSESLLAGFLLIYQQLEKMIKKYGVQEITENTIFNPELHEALVHVDSPDHASGDIVQVIQKGYTYKGHVIRPAHVSVAK